MNELVELAAWDALSDEALLLFETTLASEPVLSREWDTPEEDTTWECLGDVELDSPNWLGESFAELEARGFRRINDPREIKLTDLQLLEMAFKSWLYLYERTMTERWNKLAISEIDTLTNVQWAELQKEYDGYKKASPSSPSSETTQAA